MAIQVSRSTLDRHVLVDGGVSLVIDMEDGFSSIRICLEGGEEIEFSRSVLPQVSGLCQHALKLLWDLYPGVAPEIATSLRQMADETFPAPQTNVSPPTLTRYPAPLMDELEGRTQAQPAPPQQRPVNVPENYGQPAPKPQAREGLPVTVPQLGFIENLGKALHLELEGVLERANMFQPGRMTWADIEQMDRKKASQLIESMKAELEARKAEEGVPT